MLGGYSVNPSPVLAGQEFGLSVTLQNTSDSQPIKNMKVTVSGETADIIPIDVYKRQGVQRFMEEDEKMGLAG